MRLRGNARAQQRVEVYSHIYVLNCACTCGCMIVFNTVILLTDSLVFEIFKFDTILKHYLALEH